MQSPQPCGGVVFRGSQPVAGQRGTGGAVGIEGVGLAFETAGGLDRPSHLDDLDARSSESPGESGAVAGGALDPDPLHLPQRGQKSDGCGVAGAGGWELPVTDRRTGHRDRRDVDGVGVGVRAGDDERGFCEDDGVPSDLMLVGHTPAWAGRQDIDEERPGS